MFRKKAITPDPSLAVDFPVPDGLSFDTVYSEEPRAGGEQGLALTTLVNQRAFSVDNQIFTHAPLVIKYPGSMVHALPPSYKQFEEAVRLAAAYEAAHSGLLYHKKCELTVRQSRLSAGSFQCNDGVQNWHTDYGGDRDRYLVDHIYVVADHSPTMLQGRRLAHAFNELSRDASNGRQAAPYELNIFTNYCWHRSMPVTEDCVRTFVRIAYLSPDKAELDRIYNVRNLVRPSLYL